MTAWRTSWSMVGKWLIYVSDPEGGEQQLCLPEHMKAEAHLLGAAEELAAALEQIIARAPAQKPGGPHDELGGYSSDNLGDVISDAKEEEAWQAAEIARAAFTKAGRTPCSETVG